jgi:sulfate adenylyltransferase
MSSSEFYSVINNFCLPDGHVWTIPITLEVSENLVKNFTNLDRLDLNFKGEYVAEVKVLDIYKISRNDIYKLFQTKDQNHPGVKKEISKSPFRLGCSVLKFNKNILKGALNPLETVKVFKKNNWKTIVGFQTRNPVHRAHEYLQRLGMEVCDGIFINPLVGWKKVGDFSEVAIQKAYGVMIKKFYPPGKVYFKELRTQMRYAGPKEAIFHSIIRRNLGCTHFIIGRDHAGVGDYYGIYEAHSFAKKITNKHSFGIELLLCKEPYFCELCDGIVSENHCSHYDTHRIEVSGTIIRKALSDGKVPDTRMMREEVAKAIIALGDKKFVSE